MQTIKTFLFSILPVFFLTSAFSQDLKIETDQTVLFGIKKYSKTQPDTIIEWGHTFVYEHHKSNQFKRTHYDPTGNKKSIVTIIQVPALDTSVTFSTETYEELIQVVSGLEDQAHGKYVDFFQDETGGNSIKTAGQYKNGKRAGKWVSYQITKTGSKKKNIIHFNKEGKIEGKYLEYFLDPNTTDEKIKVRGKYASEEKEVQELNSATYEVHWKKKKVPVKKGKWKFYNMDGTVQKIEKY